MNYTYNWSVTNINVSVNSIDGFDDVIVSCDWLIEGSLLWTTPGLINNNGVELDGFVNTINENLSGNIVFEKPNANSFIQLKDLNQSTILNWIWELVEKEEKQSELKLLLDNKKNNQTKIVNIR